MSDYYASSQGGGWSADAYLAHYGVLSMKWGQRHFQNKDGTWTESGKRHRQAYVRSGEKDAVNAVREQYKKKQKSKR